MAKKNYYFFVGTIAEFIKLAPIIRELQKRHIPFKIISTGQNTINFGDFTGYIKPVKADIKLKEKEIRSSIFHFAIWAVRSVFLGIFVLQKEFRNLSKKDTYLIIHGDTVSSLIGALIAKICGLKLVHVESGLRSFNFFEPFPEEICRFINIHLADFLFAPTDWAMENIKNLKGKKINTSQNTLIEINNWTLTSKRNLDYIKKFKKYYILIMHRQEHVYFKKEWTRQMLDIVTQNANKDLNCIFIMHSLTSRFLQSERLNTDAKLSKRLLFVPKLPYMDFINLMNKAEFIATDGCTNQEEAYYMGLPFLALRNRTERVEGVGQNVVISKGDPKIIKNFLKNYKKYRRKPVKIYKSPSKIIVDYLSKS